MGWGRDAKRWGGVGGAKRWGGVGGAKRWGGVGVLRGGVGWGC